MKRKLPHYIYLVMSCICGQLHNILLCFVHIIIIIIILESAVQGRERVKTLYQSKDPNPTQPTHGRKR